MKISAQSDWGRKQLEGFLEQSTIPMRLTFVDGSGHPRVCSLWYLYDQGTLWAASHANSYVVKQLMADNRVSFDVSTNAYPYMGVRGKGVADLMAERAEAVLGALIQKYLGNSNRPLAHWLLSRIGEEYAIRIVPSSVNAWDFSGRMEKSPLGADS